MDDLDSIDGLGLTFADLSDAGRAKAIFRQLRINARDNLSQAERAAIKQSLAKSKAIDDESQQIGRDIVSQ